MSYRSADQESPPTSRFPTWVRPLLRMCALVLRDKRRIVGIFWGVYASLSLLLMGSLGIHRNVTLSLVACVAAVLCIPFAEICRRRGLVWRGDVWITTFVICYVAGFAVVLFVSA